MDRIPRKRDVDIIAQSNGRKGLIRLMNQLDKASEIPTMLLYYLQFLDFNELFESLESPRKRIIRRSLDEESVDEPIAKERYLLSAEDVLEKRARAHAHLIIHHQNTPPLSQERSKYHRNY